MNYVKIDALKAEHEVYHQNKSLEFGIENTDISWHYNTVRFVGGTQDELHED